MAKSLTRCYWYKGVLYEPDTPWKDVPTEIREREEYLNSEEYERLVKRRDPSRDLKKEQRMWLESYRAQKDEEARMKEIESQQLEEVSG